MATNTVLEIMIVDAASWKLKVLQWVIKFLNWATFPVINKNKQTVIITVTFDISTVVTPNEK